MLHASKNNSRHPYFRVLLSIAMLVALLGIFSAPVEGKAQAACPYPYDICETIRLRSTTAELKKEGENVRGYTRAQFVNQGNGVINTTLDVNSADLLSWQLGGSKIRIKNLDTGQLVPPGSVEYCSLRNWCNRKYSSFNITADTQYQAELEVDYGVLVLPIKDYYLTATVSDISLDSRNVVLREENGEIRGVALGQFTPSSDGEIEWELNATGPENIPDWVGPAGLLVKNWLIEMLSALNTAEENLPYQLGGSKLLIRNFETGELVLAPQEYCSTRALCSSRSGRVFVSKGITYEVELQVDYGILIGLLKDHVLTAEFSEMVEVDPRDDIWDDAAYYAPPFQGNLEFSGDQDWQKITVPAGGRTLMLDVPDGKNYELELWRDDVKTKLAESKNSIGVDEFIPIAQPGTYRIHIYGVNPATDFNASYGVSLIVDNTAPVSAIALSGTAGTNGWFRSNVQVILSATDNPGGSGVQKIEYGFSYTPWIPFTGPWIVYNNPFTISAEGHTYLEFRSTDNAGNIEPNQSQVIRIDTVAPEISGSISPPAPNLNGWYNTNVTVGFSATDFQSGIASLIPMETTLTNEGAGQSVTGTVIDNAGNSTSLTMGNINIDKTAPILTLVSPQATAYTRSSSLTVAWTAMDNLSGIQTTSAALDNQPVANGQEIDLYTLSLGPHTVTLQAKDKADNISNLSVTFNVTADVNSLLDTTNHVYDLGWIEKKGVYTSLTSSLKAAQASMARNQLNAARNQLMAFLNKLEAQKGKAINQQAYDLLKADVMYVIEHLQ
jgi:hypothetical protein